MTYLSAFPRVWPSFRNSNEAAVGVEPGSYWNVSDHFLLTIFAQHVRTTHELNSLRLFLLKILLILLTCAVFGIRISHGGVVSLIKRGLMGRRGLMHDNVVLPRTLGRFLLAL